jgi:hypothetical protein
MIRKQKLLDERPMFLIYAILNIVMAVSIITFNLFWGAKTNELDA